MPPRDRAVRGARALARARPHLPADAAGPVERPRRGARRRAGRRRAATLLAATRCRTRCWSTSPRPWPATAGCGWSSDPVARPGAARHRPGRARGGASVQAGRDRWSVPGSTTTRSLVHPAERGTLKQALLKLGWPAEDLAGYVDGEAHPIELVEDGWSLRHYQQEAVDGFWHGGSGVVVLPCGAGKTLVGAAAMAQAKATTLILVTNTVAARQWRDELLKRTIADRGGDRRVLRRHEGDPAGHRRDLPGADHPPEGRLHPPRAARRPRLGPDHLRRGPPAAGADLPDDRRPAGPPPARPDRHAGPRGRPRGRRVHPDRAQALRRAVEGHRGAGLDRAGRLRRGAGRRCRRRAAGVRRRRARGALPAVLDAPTRRPASSSGWSRGTPASRRW